jgi:hypothetical protein
LRHNISWNDTEKLKILLVESILYNPSSCKFAGLMRALAFQPNQDVHFAISRRFSGEMLDGT